MHVKEACRKERCHECNGEGCPFGIQLMSNNEIVHTLLSRPTFLGVIIQSEEEILPGSAHQNFILSTNKHIRPKDLVDILLAATKESFQMNQENKPALVVLPKSAAKNFTHDKPWACISIGDEPGDWPDINKVQLVDILRIAFADINQPMDGHIIFSEEHAQKILDFVDKVWDKIDLLMIHCLAGISRSPAVAAAIAKEKYNDDMMYFNLYTPNSLVYQTILNAT